MEEFEEEVFEKEHQKEILKTYGKAFLSDTIKDFKRELATVDEIKKWNNYKEYFIESKFKHEKEMQEIKEDYGAKYLLILSLLGEYETIKADFDRQNLKIEAVLSDTLLMAKEEKLKEFCKAIVETHSCWQQSLEAINKTLAEIDAQERGESFRLPWLGKSFWEEWQSKLLQEQQDILANAIAYEKFNSCLNPMEYSFVKDIQEENKIKGITGLVKIAIDNYTKGLAVENVLDFICFTENLTSTLQKDLLEMSSFRVTLARISEILDEIEIHRSEIEESASRPLTFMLKQYQAINRKKINELKNDLLQAEIEASLTHFKRVSKKIKVKTIIEKQIEIQPLVKNIVSSVQGLLAESRGW